MADTNYFNVEETEPGDLSLLLDLHSDSRATRTFTSGPGIIIEFYPETQTAMVQPATKRYHRFENEDSTVTIETLPLPQIDNVPVLFPQAGGFHLTFPVKPGDECLITYAQRPFNNWLNQGGIQDPSSVGMLHSVNGAVAHVGISSNPKKIPDFNSDDAEFRNTAGDQVVQLKSNGDVFIKSITGITMTTIADVNIECANLKITTTEKSSFEGTGLVDILTEVKTPSLTGMPGQPSIASIDSVVVGSSANLGGVEHIGHVHNQQYGGITGTPM